mmetsp:Transcript_16511/g.46950  ORF Transcript_16511/g.46950 Transcript_16511/m.46950 type:complete len:442 (-) Transcript_16511:373-1698(-)
MSNGGSPLERLIPPGSLLACFNVVTASAIGTGVLTLPWAIKESGLGLGLILVVCAALVANISLNILMMAACKTRSRSYADLLAWCIGPLAGPLIDFLIFFETLVSISCYFIFLGDFSSELLMLFDVPAWLKEKSNLVLLSLVIIAPLCLPSKLSYLRYTSTVSLVGLFWTTVVVVTKTPSLYRQRTGQASGIGGNGEAGEHSIQWMVLSPDCLKTASIGVFAFFCHFNIVPAARELKNPTTNRMLALTTTSSIFLVVFFSLLASCGYLSWLDDLQEDFLANYPPEDPLVIVSRVLLTATMVCMVPVREKTPRTELLSCFPQLMVHPMLSSLTALAQWNTTRSDDKRTHDRLLPAGTGSDVQASSYGTADETSSSFCEGRRDDDPESGRTRRYAQRGEKDAQVPPAVGGSAEPGKAKRNGVLKVGGLPFRVGVVAVILTTNV